MKKICLEIPRDVDYILRRLDEAGFEAFAVGGCVRDALLGRVPNDWDITTSARPEEVKKVFRRTIDTGLKHGTVTVLVGKKQPAGGQGSGRLQNEAGDQDCGGKMTREAGGQTSASQANAVQVEAGGVSGSGRAGGLGSGLRTYEVTTYRIDGAYEDSRHPKEVTFTSNLEEDLRRRDFTINAMAYHPEVGIVDPYGGMADLEAGVIRAVGNARERFDEDALRIMRAVRFSAQLGFAIDPETALALKEFAPRLNDISRERIRDELLKLITSPYPETFELLYNMKITREIFPRFDEMMAAPPAKGRAYNFGTLALYAMEEVSATPVLRLAALLLHAGAGVGDADGAQATGGADEAGAGTSGARQSAANFAKHFLREMRLDNNTIHDVGLLVEMVGEVNAGAGDAGMGNAIVTSNAGKSNLAAEVFECDMLKVGETIEISEYDVRVIMNKVGELMPAMIELLRADAKGFVAARGENACDAQQSNAWLGDCGNRSDDCGDQSDNCGDRSSDCAAPGPREIMLARAEKIDELYEMIDARGDCTSLKTLAVTGGDLIDAGFKPGPDLGKILAALLGEVLRDPAANEKRHLLGKAKSLYSRRE